MISDSHGDKYNFLKAVEKEPTADVVLFLGDGYRDYEEVKLSYIGKKAFFAVSGNCDLACNFPDKILHNFQGYKFYITHGYMEKVKFGIDNLLYAAQQDNCNVVVYGHTHQPVSTFQNDIHILNPGSVGEGFYGVIDITDKGIMCINKNLITY